MVAGSGACDDGDHTADLHREFAAAAPQLQRINDDWEQQLRKMFEKAAEAEASQQEDGGADDGLA